MKKTAVSIIVIMMFLLIGIVSALADEAAMVVELKDGAAVYESGQKQGEKVMLMDFVNEGEKIKIDKGATLVLNYFVSGAREEINGPGIISVGLEGSEKTGKVAIQSAKVDYIPSKARTGSGEAEHLGVVALRDTGPAKADKVFPISLSKTAARTMPLTFRWGPIGRAENYSFKILDSAGKVVVKAETKEPVYVLEKETLSPGKEYSWNVEALSGKRKIAEGGSSFYMLDESRAGQVATTEQYIQKNYKADSTEYFVALVMLYTKYQLNDEARPILLTLRQSNPTNTNIVKQIRELQTNYSPGD